MWFKRSRKDKDLEEEIASHLRMAARDADAARARREFGNVGLVQEVTREMWGWSAWERFWQDVFYALRVLRKNPGYALTAVLSLALGIGANTAIFSLIDSIMLKSLPVKNPQELVLLGDPTAVQSVLHGTGGDIRLFSYPFYKRFRDSAGVFSGLYAAGRAERIDLADETEHPHARFVSNNFFDVLGVGAVQGRTFQPDDRETIVISYDFWQRHEQGAADIAGRKLTVNRRDFTIVGVAPPRFYGDVVGYEVDLWFPIEVQAEADPGRDYRNDVTTRWLQLMGRLKPGTSLAQASTVVNTRGLAVLREQMAGVSTATELESLLKQKVNVEWGGTGFSRIRRSFAQPLKILMLLVGLVLLICCANVANLQMARAVKRGREMALRLAIGASRGRLLRQLLTESLVLVLAGGVTALFFAYWMSRLLLGLAAQNNHLPLEPHISGAALLFTAAISVLAVLAFGLAPALFASSRDVAAHLKESKMGRSQGATQLFEKGLVALQIMLSLVLLYGSGLFIRSLRNLENSELGYRRQNLLIAETDPWAAGYKDPQIGSLAQKIVDQLRSVPGVGSVSFSENGLFNGTESVSTNLIEGFTARSPEDSQNRSDKVGPGYFSTVGIPLLAGREVAESDRSDGARVVIIDEAMARFYFKNRPALGSHISDLDGKQSMTVVGVVGDAKQRDLREPPARRMYTPYGQFAPGDQLSGLRFEIRTQTRTGMLETAVRRAIHQAVPAMREPNVKWMQTLIEHDLQLEQVIAKLSGFFSVLALLLASVGLYGVMSYLTEKRTTEVGVRMALGASRKSVLSLILRESLAITALGLLAGGLCAFALGKLLGSSLYGVSAFDPLTLAAAGVLMSGSALLAGWFPAHRASRIDPMIALRAD